MEAMGKFDFSATANDELSFNKGDIIKILGTNDNWYRAERNGQQGFVPRNYITLDIPSWYQENMSRLESENTLMPQPIGSFIIRSSQSSPGNFSISVRHEADVQHFKVLRDTRGQYFLWTEKFNSLNEMVNYYTLNSISKQCLIRLLSEHRSQFPDPRPVPQERRHKREELQSRPLSPPAKALPPPQSQFPDPRPVPQHSQAVLMKVKALYNFTAEEQDELNFSAGDIIEVLDRSESLWWKGRVRGRTGLFPANYITIL